MTGFMNRATLVVAAAVTGMLLADCGQRPTAPKLDNILTAGLPGDTLVAVQLAVPKSFVELDAFARQTGVSVEVIRLDYPGFGIEYQLNGRHGSDAQADFTAKHQHCLDVLQSMTEQLGIEHVPPGLSASLSQAKAEIAGGNLRFSVVGLRLPKGSRASPQGTSLRSDIQLDDQAPNRVNTTPGDRRTAQPYAYNHPDHNWAPYEGLSDVGRDYTSQAFRFNTTFGGLDTYEHEVQVANTSYARYDGYSSSTMPEWYVHNEQPNNTGWDTFVVGSARANRMSVDVYYFTYQALKPEGASTSAMSLKGQLHRRLFTGAAWWMAQLIDTTVPGLTSYTIPGMVHWHY